MSLCILFTEKKAPLWLLCFIFASHGSTMRVRREKAESPCHDNPQRQLAALHTDFLDFVISKLPQSTVQASYCQSLKALTRMLLAFTSPAVGSAYTVNDNSMLICLGHERCALAAMDAAVLHPEYPCDFTHVNDSLPDIAWLAPPFTEGGPWRKVKHLQDAIYGTVYLVEKNHDIPDATNLPKSFAIKTIQKSIIEEKRPLKEALVIDSAENEIRAFHYMKKMQLPGVVEVYGVWQDNDSIYIATEFCPRGDVFELMLKNEYRSEDQIRKLIIQQLKIVKQLHDKGIAHHDVSLTNFLVCKDGSQKLVDFGQAVQVHVPDADYDEMLVPIERQGHPGKPDHLPPEFLWNFASNGTCVGMKYSAKKMDIFQIGVGLSRLLARRPLYDAPKFREVCGPGSVLFPPEEAATGRCRGVVKWLHSHSVKTEHISDNCLDFLQCMLAPNWKKRPTIDEALAHPWIIDGPGTHSALQLTGQKNWRVKHYRKKISELYEAHNPAKVHEVDGILTEYAGREQELYRAVQKKYLGGS